MINTRLIWYLDKYRILDRSQCGFRKHRSTTDRLDWQQAVGLFFDMEKAYETTWQYGIIRDLHRIGLRGRLPVFVSEYLRDRRIRVRIGTTLFDEFYPEEGVPTGGVLDSVHNSGLRLALGAFCTSPVSSLYTEANEAPLKERRLKLSMHYYVKTRACIDSPAHHALHEFDRTSRNLYAPRPNGRGGMTRPPAPPIGLKVEEAMTSAEINAKLVCPLRTPNFPPGTHDYDPKRHDLIEGVSKCMISTQEAQAKFNEFREAQGSHDEVYTDGSKMNERVGAAAVINRHFQNGETTSRQLSKWLPDYSTIFAAEATAISLALSYYQHMGPVHHDVVVYSDSMSCLQAIEGEDIENPFICHIMNLLWSLSDKGTHVRFSPQSVVTLSQLGGLRASKTPEAMPAGVWLLVGLTMMDRLRSRGQTKCNTPLLLMLATSVFGEN